MPDALRLSGLRHYSALK